MATFTKYNTFVQNLMDKLLDLFGTTDTVRMVIHSDAPAPTTDNALSDWTETSGTGYSAGGEDTQNDSTRTTDTVTVTAVDIVWTGGAGGFTAARYVSAYDDTSAGNNAICSYDYGANFTVAAGETFTVDFGASWFTIA
jgi:hypothetical protein